MNTYQETLKTCAEILRNDFGVNEESIHNYSPKMDDIHACRFFFSESNAYINNRGNQYPTFRTFSDYLSHQIIINNPDLTNTIKNEIRCTTDHEVQEYIKDALLTGEGILIYL